MNEANDENRNVQLNAENQTRREFMATSAAAVAGMGAAGIFHLPMANAAGTKNLVAIGNGPYPVEGMAAYSPNGPQKLMKFQRRALGPKDVAIKIHYCGVCHSDIHTIRED